MPEPPGVGPGLIEDNFMITQADSVDPALAGELRRSLDSQPATGSGASDVLDVTPGPRRAES